MASDSADRRRRLVFVCAHGAVRSRVAAALFNQVAPAGWCAISVGLEPQPELGETARRLLEGSGAARFLDTDPPHALHPPLPDDRFVAIDCEVIGADLWQLHHQEFSEPMLVELRHRVLAMTVHITSSPDS